MKKRLLKALSFPILLALLPVIILGQGLLWIINGKKSPMYVIEEYMDWLIDN
jgi:hypothetical protein